MSSDIVIGLTKSRLSGNGPKRVAADNPSGEALARVFKYLRQSKEPGRNFKAPSISRISAHTFYIRHRTAFDKTADFFARHGLDAAGYLRFFVNDLGKSGSDVDEWLFSKKTLSEYVTKLQIAEKRSKIWEWFGKSVKNIVRMCIEQDYMSGKDCMMALIKTRRIAQEFVSGRISRYFFAAMPNFRSIIPRLDHFAREEFAELHDKFDIYNTEINDAFLAYRNRLVNPLRLVDEELAKARAERTAAGSDRDLFDPDL